MIPDDVISSLQANIEPDVSYVARQKMLNGDLGLSPFLGMENKVFPDALSWIDEDHRDMAIDFRCIITSSEISHHCAKGMPSMLIDFTRNDVAPELERALYMHSASRWVV